MYGIGDILSTYERIYRHYMIVVAPNLIVHTSKKNSVAPANFNDVGLDFIKIG